MSYTRCLTAFLIASSLATTGTVYANAQTISPKSASEFDEQTDFALEVCYLHGYAELPPGLDKAELSNIVRAIGKAEGAKNFSYRAATSLCNHFKLFWPDAVEGQDEGECNIITIGSSEITKDINVQLCRKNGQPALGPKGAWERTEQDRLRTRLTSEIRKRVDALTLLETGQELTKEQFSDVYGDVYDMLENQNFEAALSNGECATNRLHANYDYDITICEQDDKLVLQKDAVTIARPLP